jgi:UDP-N-acetylmuramyl pentapeptide phosphotransferase/UDP-N-acetylglucosamine-1-phosphate transferase
LAANAGQGNVGTLVSTESLSTFGGLTFAISVVWGGIERMFDIPHTMWIGGLLSLIIGAILLYDDLTDAQRRLLPRIHLRILAAVVNSFVLFGAASTLVSQTVPSAKPPVTTAAAPK